MAAASSIAAIGSVLSGVGAVAGTLKGGKTGGSATAALDAVTAKEKKKKAIQQQQRKPVETFLTGGQGVAGQAQGVTLG